MATTIKEIIAELSAIEDQDQPVIFAYWTADLFEFADGETETPTPEQFAEIIEEISEEDLFSDPYNIINDIVYDFMSKLNEEEDEEEDN